MSKNSFKKSERIKLRKDFNNLFDHKGRVVSKFFVIVYTENNLEHSRIAFSIKKKFGKAYLRNRLKRYIRETYRNNKGLFPSGYDILFIPRKGLSEVFSHVSYKDIKTHIFELLEQFK